MINKFESTMFYNIDAVWFGETDKIAIYDKKEIDLMVLSQKLKEIRQKRNYSQLYVAEKLHISRQAISK